MNERIKKLRKALDLTQQAFADRIGSKRTTIAKYETATNIPSSAVIALICREFNVNEVWLRTGDGEMFAQQSKEDELTTAVNRLLSGESSEFKRRLILVLSKLDIKEWEILERRLNEITNARVGAKSIPDDPDLDDDAKLQKEADEFAAMAREQFLSEKRRASKVSSAKESDAG